MNLDTFKTRDFKSFSWPIFQLGRLACSVILQLGGWHLRMIRGREHPPGPSTCRSSVRAKLGANMFALGDPGVSRLAEETRIVPGEKISSRHWSCNHGPLV